MSVLRRNFLKLAALGAVGATILEAGVAGGALGADDTKHIDRRDPKTGIKLGVASYSLRNFPRERAIEMTKSLGVHYINFKSMHLPYDASPMRSRSRDNSLRRKDSSSSAAASSPSRPIPTTA